MQDTSRKEGIIMKQFNNKLEVIIHDFFEGMDK